MEGLVKTELKSASKNWLRFVIFSRKMAKLFGTVFTFNFLNGPNMLDFNITLFSNGLLGINTPAYLVTKKINCCEYGPGAINYKDFMSVSYGHFQIS